MYYSQNKKQVEGPCCCKRKFKIPVIKEDVVGGAMTSNRIVGMTSSSMKSPHSSSMASSIVEGDYMDFQNR